MSPKFWMALIGAAGMAFAAIAGAAALGGSGQGKIEVAGDNVSCPDGSQVQSRFVLDGGTFRVTGLLKATTADQITVTGPSGEVPATLSPGVTVPADVQANQPVTVDGNVLADTQSYVATAVASACPAAPPLVAQPAQATGVAHHATATPAVTRQADDEDQDEADVDEDNDEDDGQHEHDGAHEEGHAEHQDDHDREGDED